MSNPVEDKSFQPTEKSLKYMAWNIKEISEHLKSLAVSMKIIAEKVMNQNPSPKFSPTPKQEEIPF